MQPLSAKNLDDYNCPICLELLDGVRDKVVETNCGHHFHEKDLLEWLKRKDLCPLCNGKVSKIEENKDIPNKIQQIKRQQSNDEQKYDAIIQRAFDGKSLVKPLSLQHPHGHAGLFFLAHEIKSHKDPMDEIFEMDLPPDVKQILIDIIMEQSPRAKTPEAGDVD